MEPDDRPDIEEWVEESGGALDYLNFAAARLALSDWTAATQLFRPRFIETSGCVIWERAYNADNFREWHSNLNGDLTSIERVLNEVRLWQFVEIQDANPRDERRVRALAHHIAFFWRASVAHDFPDKTFEVDVQETEDGPSISCVVQRTSY